MERSVLDAVVRLTVAGSSDHPESKWALWLSGWDFCLWDRGIIRTSGYALMAASPIWHPPLSGIGAILGRIAVIGKFELGAVKWESEIDERVLFCPWGEELCTWWGQVNVKYRFLPANQMALMRLRRLSFDVLLHGIRRRSEFLKWKVNVVRNQEVSP